MGRQWGMESIYQSFTHSLTHSFISHTFACWKQCGKIWYHIVQTYYMFSSSVLGHRVSFYQFWKTAVIWDKRLVIICSSESQLGTVTQPHETFGCVCWYFWLSPWGVATDTWWVEASNASKDPTVWGPQPLGRGPVHGLLGATLHSRRWGAGEYTKLRLHYCLSSTSCLYPSHPHLIHGKIVTKLGPLPRQPPQQGIIQPPLSVVLRQKSWFGPKFASFFSISASIRFCFTLDLSKWYPYLKYAISFFLSELCSIF